MTTIRFTTNEINYVYAVAALIADEVKSRPNAIPKYDPGVEFPAIKIGCLGEYALAKYLGVNWGFTPYDLNANDVDGYEVRATMRMDGCLLTKDTDKLGVYVLATGDKVNKTITLQGWATLTEANTPARWAEFMPKPCYRTPQNLLHPMATLPNIR